MSVGTLSGALLIGYVEYEITTKRIKEASHKINLYKHAFMVCLKDHMTQFKDIPF